MHDSRHSARPVATAALSLTAELDGQMSAVPLAAGRGRWPRPRITSRPARALHGSIPSDGEVLLVVVSRADRACHRSERRSDGDRASPSCFPRLT